METILITGASRGIGFGLTEEFLRRGHKVIAAVRNPDGARPLWELERDYPDRLSLLELDVADPQSIAELPGKLLNKTIDVLVNNAGVLPTSGNTLGTLEAIDLEKAFKVNTVAPAMVTKACLDSLVKASHPRVVNVTSKMGSIADNQSGGNYAYRISKTALNMLTKCLALELKSVTTFALHPGWVQTEMGGSNAPITVTESASAIVDLIQNIKHESSGSFFDFRGAEIPW